MLLINPVNAEYGGSLSRFVPLSLPMPIGCLAAQMMKYGHPVRIVDEEVRPITMSNIDELVTGLPRPYIFGITVLTAQVARTFHLATLLKTKFPDCVVMVGGYHTTALPEESLTAVDTIDFVVRGEGERTLIQLYEAIRGGRKDFSDIQGISYRRDGKIVHNPDMPLIQDLDTLPKFPYDLFDNLLKQSNSRATYDWGFIVTSRGCPYRCNYCAMRMMTGNTYRFKSADLIVEELDVLVNRFGARNVFFLDDNFCFKKSRTSEVCDALIQSGLGKKCGLSLQTRADNFYKDVVPMLRDAGFTSVGFGMEVGTDRLAEVIHKGESIQQHINAVKLAQSHGLDTALFMIFGIPTETHDDRKVAYELCKSLNVTHIKFNNLIPYPGTPFYTDVKDTPRMNKLGIWENFTSTLAEMGMPLTHRRPLPYVPETASEWELSRDIIRFNILAALRPSIIKGVLLRKHGPGWFKLKSYWFLRPTELFHLMRLAAVLIVNLLISFLPLWPLENIIQFFVPGLQRRVSAKDRKPYVPSGWPKDSWQKVMT